MDNTAVFQPTFVLMPLHSIDSILKVSTCFSSQNSKKPFAISLIVLLHGTKWPKYLLPGSTGTMIHSSLFWVYLCPTSSSLSFNLSYHQNKW